MGVRALEVGMHTGVSDDGVWLPMSVVYAMIPYIRAQVLHVLSTSEDRIELALGVMLVQSRVLFCLLPITWAMATICRLLRMLQRCAHVVWVPVQIKSLVYLCFVS